MTVEERIQMQLGALLFQVAVLGTENERLTAQLAAAGLVPAAPPGHTNGRPVPAGPHGGSSV